MMKISTLLRSRKQRTLCFVTMLACLSPMKVNAQLSSNPDKFLGNITTRYQMDAGGGVDPYYKLWNQVTPENESKWGSVEGTRGSFNWGCDTPFNYAKKYGFTYKFHAFVWGAQYPNWFSNSLSISERYKAIVTWFDAVKKKYPELPMIDVVNEAVGMHQQGNPLMKESLGGGGKTGYDWLIRAFEMAYERYPDAILIYNDFNTFQHDTNSYLELVRTLRDFGAPIDAYGNQSHDVNDISVDKLKSSMKTLNDGLKMPMYITELDIDIADDNKQKKQYEDIFPIMWEAEQCAGVTIWGYIHGATWVSNSGIIKNGKDRPAMTWLREYMQSDAAKNAKSPFPGMKKEASVYIRPADMNVAKGDKLPIKLRASMATKTIEKIDLYVGEELIATLTEAPYLTEYAVPADAEAGWKELKAVITATDGSTYERYSRFNVLNSTELREPFNGAPVELPGTINVTEFDKGAQTVSYNKASRTGTSSMQSDGWMEYTVNVKEDGIYSFDAEVASTSSSGVFHLAEYSLDGLKYLSDFIAVPNTGSTTDFQVMHGELKMPLTAGQHRICLNIDKGGFYIKSIAFQKEEQDENISVSFVDSPVEILGGEKATITVDASSKTSTINNVKVYINNLLVATLTEAPYTVEYEPTGNGKVTVTAIATDAEGHSNSASYTLKVTAKREPFTAGKPATLPGTLQTEYYDKGGEGAAYHDNDTQNQGDANYRASEGVDIVNGNNGRALGYTSTGEWVEYTIDVQEAGNYSFKATVSSGVNNSGFSINLNKNGKITKLADIRVPQTGNNSWDTYRVVEGTLSEPLEAGEQILRIVITGSNCNIDKIQFSNTATGIIDINNDAASQQGSYDLFGRKVNDSYKGIIIQNGKKIINK
ncbi:MAG: endo-1,4-beta-xylanase [Prevotella sp.]|nr:endo-1,4-beta-xylanase [Prevotella sp.]